MPTTAIVITIGDARLSATFDDNATSEAVLSRMPIALTMQDLYGHELVYRFDAPLPTTDLITRAPRRGDIVYWAPRNALAIFYADGDEAFSDIQMAGHVDAGIDLVEHPGDCEARFARAED